MKSLIGLAIGAIAGAPFLVGKENPRAYLSICWAYYLAGMLIMLAAYVGLTIYEQGFRSGLIAAEYIGDIDPTPILTPWTPLWVIVSFLGYMGMLWGYWVFLVRARLEPTRPANEDRDKD